MVEYTISLDNIFSSLADPTRRDILARITKKELSVGDIAKHYKLTFAAISKHLGVLEKAKLIVKHRQGKEQIIQLSPAALMSAADYLRSYELMWSRRLDALDELLKIEKKKLRKT